MKNKRRKRSLKEEWTKARIGRRRSWLEEFAEERVGEGGSELEREWAGGGIGCRGSGLEKLHQFQHQEVKPLLHLP